MTIPQKDAECENSEPRNEFLNRARARAPRGTAPNHKGMKYRVCVYIHFDL